MNNISRMSRIWIRGAALIGTLFGLMTIREGGAVLFFDGPAREAAGNYVPFVLWFNFLAGFAYVITGIGLWRRRRWATWAAIGIATATLFVFAAFTWHVVNGGAYEFRTVIAMSLRSTIWVFIAAIAWRDSRSRNPDSMSSPEQFLSSNKSEE